MAKLRKMLGDITSRECRELMAVIETQSKHTLGTWAVSYAKEQYLPIYAKGETKNSRLEETVAACERFLAGEGKLAEVKPLLKEARELCAKIKDPTEQAAARAVATACAAIQTPTNTFGFLLYGAAASAYDQAGLEETGEVYDALAAKELQKALDSLQQAAVKDEPNPVKIKWNC